MSDKPASKPPRAETQSEREQRLAEALRANLKRRKAAKKPEKAQREP
ncbi:MAG: hypothetical protein ACFE0P_06065 [Oceanicaulis sp.]